ncbi:MAG: hypothetical protein K0M64_07295 [Rhizobium sp.]|nr:hypothetical protein [Rhizobium sp.]
MVYLSFAACSAFCYRTATALLLATLLTTGCGLPADGAPEPQVTLVGELHGTREHPRAFLDLVGQAAARSDQPVLVGLELPPDAVAVARRALQLLESERLAVLLESSTWANNPDGRASMARLELIRDLLALEASGEVSVIGIDLRESKQHDLAAPALARVLAERGNRENPVMLLVGNGHLGVGEGRATLGQSFVDQGLATTLLTLHYSGGNAWNCVAGACGPRELGANLSCPDGTKTLRPGLVVSDTCLGKVTLSPLARDELGPAPAAPHRVLFVGNSLIYTGNLPAVLETLSARDHHALEADMIATGGATLSDRVADGSVARALATGRYRTVVLQERGGDFLCAFGPGSCVQARAALASLARLAREHGASPVLLGTYQGDPRASASLASAEAMAARDAGVPYLQVTRYLQAGLAAHPRLAWFASDGMHPGPDLTLLQALLLHKHLFARVPDAVDFTVEAPIHAYSAHLAAEAHRATDVPDGSKAATSYTYGARHFARIARLLRHP